MIIISENPPFIKKARLYFQFACCFTVEGFKPGFSQFDKVSRDDVIIPTDAVEHPFRKLIERPTDNSQSMKSVGKFSL